MKIAEMYSFDWPQCYVLMLRFLYGFPLDGDINDVDIMTIKELYDAAGELEIQDLRAYALRKMEERIVEKAHSVTSDSEEGPPSPTDTWLDPFVRDVELLLDTDERTDDAEEMSSIVIVVVKVCCKYYAIIRQHESFTTLRQTYPRLPFDMLNYVAAKGGNMLGFDPRLGTHAVIDSYLEFDHEK